MRQFGEFFYPDAGEAKNLHGRPGPECAVLFEGQVAAPAGGGILGPCPGAGAGGQYRPAQGLAGGGELLPWRRGLGGEQALGSGAACGVDGGDQGGQDGQPFPGPLVHPGLAVRAFLLPGHLLIADRAGDGPRAPPGRVVDGPLGDVEVERPHHGQGVHPVMPRRQRLGDLPARARGPDRLDGDPLLPRRRHAGGQPQRADPGMVELQVAPEQAGQGAGQAPQRRVVDHRLSFPQVVDDQGADRPAGDGITVNQLPGCQLAMRLEHPDRGGRRRGEDAQRMQQLVEVRAGVPALRGGDGVQQLQAVPDGDIGYRAALGRQDRGDPAHRQVLGTGAGRVRPRQRSERGEAARVAGPGHLGRQVLRSCRGQQPRQAGPDDIAADQREHAAA